jgi:hypothetical protein
MFRIFIRLFRRFFGAHMVTATPPYFADLTDPAVFDPVFYAAKYPDLAAAGITTTDQLATHWATFGVKEGRQGCAAFDSTSYVLRNPEVLKVVSGCVLHNITQHYIVRGRNQGWSGAPGTAVVTP